MEGVAVSLFFGRRSGGEVRDVSSLPWDQGGPVRSAGSSMESQLGLVPVFAATRLIADSVASLPLQAFRKTQDGRQPITMPALLESPDPDSSRMEWVQRSVMSLLLRGNAYGLKTGVGEPGMPRSIRWLDPDAVEWHDGRWLYQGREVPGSQMFHVPGLVLPGSRLGVSPLGACRMTVTSGSETQRFMRDWFANKAIPGMVLRNSEQTLSAEDAQVAKERVRATMRAGEPFVTGKDWSLDVMRLPADDAGFVQSARLNATQIASIYGVPPEMIGGEAGGSLTYSTVELNQLAFVTNTLRPWIVRLEAALSSLLPRPQYVKFNIDALVRADTKTRWEVHQIARSIGAESVNEIRALEDREPIEGGDDFAPLRGSAPAPNNGSSDE